MKKKLIISLLILSIASSAWGINIILGGAVQFIFRCLPNTVSQLSSAAVFEPQVLSNNTFLGSRNTGTTNTRVYRSNDGITWSALTMPDAAGTKGIDFSGIRYLVFEQNPGGIGGCGVYYSDDNGVNWTLVQLNDTGLGGNGLDNCQPAVGFAESLYCSGSTCVAVGINLSNNFGCLNAPCLNTAVSVDSGSNWSASTPPLGDSQHRTIRDGKVLIFDNTTVVVTSGPGSTCTDGGTVQFPIIAFSTNSGGSYSTTNVGDTICWNFYSGSKLGNNYILVAEDSDIATDVPIFWTSTNLTTWSKVTPILSPTVTASNPTDISLRCYNNMTIPTCYYSVQDNTNLLLRIYTSTDSINFTQIYSESTVTAGNGVGRFIQDSSCVVYFGTQTNKFFNITQ